MLNGWIFMKRFYDWITRINRVMTHRGILTNRKSDYSFMQTSKLPYSGLSGVSKRKNGLPELIGQ